MTQYETLYEKVKNILDKNNLSYTVKEDYTNRLVVQTKIGDWIVTPEKDRYSKIWTIFTRFEDTKSIPQYLTDNFKVNTFSGKMNFHGSTMLDIIWDFEYATGLLREQE